MTIPSIGTDVGSIGFDLDKTISDRLQPVNDKLNETASTANEALSTAKESQELLKQVVASGIVTQAKLNDLLKAQEEVKQAKAEAPVVVVPVVTSVVAAPAYVSGDVYTATNGNGDQAMFSVLKEGDVTNLYTAVKKKGAEAFSEPKIALSYKGDFNKLQAAIDSNGKIHGLVSTKDNHIVLASQVDDKLVSFDFSVKMNMNVENCQLMLDGQNVHVFGHNGAKKIRVKSYDLKTGAEISSNEKISEHAKKGAGEVRGDQYVWKSVHGKKTHTHAVAFDAAKKAFVRVAPTKDGVNTSISMDGATASNHSAILFAQKGASFASSSKLDGKDKENFATNFKIQK